MFASVLDMLSFGLTVVALGVSLWARWKNKHVEAIWWLGMAILLRLNF